jgi:hypothetical protein
MMNDAYPYSPRCHVPSYRCITIQRHFLLRSSKHPNKEGLVTLTETYMTNLLTNHVLNGVAGVIRYVFPLSDGAAVARFEAAFPNDTIR